MTNKQIEMKYKDIEEAARYKRDIVAMDKMQLMHPDGDGWDCAPSHDVMVRCTDAILELRNNTSRAKDGRLDTVKVCGVTLNHWEAQRLADTLMEAFSEIVRDREDALRDLLPQEPEDEWKRADTNQNQGGLKDG